MIYLQNDEKYPDKPYVYFTDMEVRDSFIRYCENIGLEVGGSRFVEGCVAIAHDFPSILMLMWEDFSETFKDFENTLKMFDGVKVIKYQCGIVRDFNSHINVHYIRQQKARQ